MLARPRFSVFLHVPPTIIIDRHAEAVTGNRDYFSIGPAGVGGECIGRGYVPSPCRMRSSLSSNSFSFNI